MIHTETLRWEFKRKEEVEDSSTVVMDAEQDGLQWSDKSSVPDTCFIYISKKKQHWGTHCLKS